METVAPFAQAFGVDVTVVEALRERAVGPGWIDDFMGVMFRAWSDLDYAYPGGESGRGCQNRVFGALEGLALSHFDERILVSSHGNAIALFINRIAPEFGFVAWRALRMPDVLRVVHDGQRFEFDSDFVWGLAPFRRFQDRVRRGPIE